MNYKLTLCQTTAYVLEIYFSDPTGMVTPLTSRLDIRSRLLAKLLIMSEEEITALCKQDGLTDEEVWIIKMNDQKGGKIWKT